MNFDKRWLQFEITHGPQSPGAKEDALFWYNAGQRDMPCVETQKEDDSEDDKRKDTLLRATYDLLTKGDRSRYVLSCNEIVVRYDDANCDGTCLREDIASELDIEDDTDPIPLGKEDE